MKAIVYDHYGPPEVFRYEEVPTPGPGEDEVLVRVYASSINAWDWELLRGKPFLVRMWGLRKPRYRIPGGDIAGRVTAVGSKVRQFQPGNEVFGDLSGCGWGGFAEYVSVPVDALALKPAGVTFESAASVPQAGVMALQGVRDYGQVESGQRVLINGAGGGVGTFAIQLARSQGAEVTGVDRGGKLEAMRVAGADHVIDFEREDFTGTGQRYDLILDNAAHHSIFDYRRALSYGGRYVMIGGATGRIFQIMLLGPLLSRFGSKKLGILAHKPNRNLALLGELLESGDLVPVIDRRYALSELPSAYRYFGTGQTRGKIVITMPGAGDAEGRDAG